MEFKLKSQVWFVTGGKLTSTEFASLFDMKTHQEVNLNPEWTLDEVVKLAGGTS